MNQSKRKFISLYFTGMCMGVADIIPGVSGGTIALILGVYQQLIISLQSLGSPIIEKYHISKV